MMIAIRTALVTLVLTGLVYPVAMTGLAQLIFPRQAAGSLVTDDKNLVVGSELIAQPFTKPGYFQPRPSAANYDGAGSTGSNFAVTSKKLQERVSADVARLLKENPDAVGPVPADLVTASASGLDPHITPEAARWQAPRVAKARGLALERVQQVVESQIEARDVGLIGEPRVNVLLLNLALDRQFGRPAG